MPYEFVNEHIFPCNEVHLTGGASGSGKTTLEAQNIEEWRNGRPVYGYKSYPAPFCYIACDRSLKSIQATLKRIGIRTETWPLLSAIDHTLILNSPDAIITAAKKLVSDVRVIWLDGIHSLCPAINEYEQVQTFLSNLTRGCQRHNVTIRGLGHATKVREGEAFLNPRHRFLGSVAWGGYSDTMVIIDQEKPDDPSNTNRNVYLLPRNAENQMLKYEFVEGRLELVTDAAEFILDRWLNDFKAGDQVSTANILSQAEKMKVPRTSAFRWIKKCVNDGKLLKTGHGIYTASFPQ